MKAKFRITDEIGPSSVALGHIVSPPLTPENTIATFDYSGYYPDNVSTFPGRTRYVAANYDTFKQSWFLRSVFASDAKITNRLLVKKGVTKAIPLYNMYQSRYPHISSIANWDAGKNEIENLAGLLQEVKITDRDGIVLTQDQFLYDLEFVPAILVNPKIFDMNLFYIRIYANEAPNGIVTKLNYSAVKTDTVGLPVQPGYADYVSLESLFNLYNVNYDFKEGFASSLLGYAYEGSYKDATGRNPSMVLAEDPDNGYRPSDNYYSLIYDGKEDRYHAALSDTLRLPAYRKYQQKPSPLIAIYYASSEHIIPDAITLRYYTNVPAGSTIRNNTITIVIAYAQESNGNPITAEITVTEKSTAQLAYEINKLNTAFTCYPILPIEKISAGDIFLEHQAIYGQPYNVVSSPDGYETYNMFDKSNDGGTLIRSRHYVAKYSIEPTIKTYAPTKRSALYPWCPRIKVGGFIGRTGSIYYTSPFSSQQWSTIYGYPYVDVQQEQAFFKERYIIQTEKTGLLNDPRQIKLYDEAGNSFSHMVDGIDAQHGYIFLNQVVPTNNALFIDYSHRENTVDVLNLNLNPIKPFTAIPGKLYQLKILPYWSPSLRTSVIPYSMFEVKEITTLPSNLEDSTGMILAVFAIVPKVAIEEYKLTQAAMFGGGVDMDIPEEILRRKVVDFDFLSDVGTFEGLRYPSNCVVYTKIPTFFQGTSSILLEDYSYSELLNDRIHIFGAMRVPEGTQVSFALPGNQYVTTICRGFTSTHEMLIDPLTQDLLAGTKVTFNATVEPLFSTDTIIQALKKTAAIETEFIVEYGESK